MNCSKCNAWIPDDAAFCPECGQKAEAPAAQSFCPNCGTPVAAGDMFCGGCGYRMETVEEPKQEKKTKKPGKTIPKKALTLGIAAVAVVALVILVISLFSGGGDAAYAVYIKDGQLQCAELPKANKPMELTSKMLDGDYNGAYTQSSLYIGGYVKLSEDGKRMFYPDKMEVSEYGSVYEYTLYYRDVTNSRKDAEKIESGLSGSYYINEKGNLVTYLKNGNLYQHNLKEKTKIASDVYSYRASPDGKTLLYLEMEDDEEGGNLYLKQGSKEAQKLSSNVTHIEYASEDLSLVMFSKDGTLYRCENGGEPEKVASEVNDLLAVYESGACYYTRQEEEYISWWSVIDDDTGGDSEYTKEWMQEYTMENPVRSLYYFDGKESVLISEAVVSCYIHYNYDYSAEAPVVVYTALAEGELPQVKLSEYYESYTDVYDLLMDAVEDEIASYYAVNANAAELGIEEVYSATITADGSTVYVSAEYDEEDYTRSLYKVTLSGGKIKSSELLDDDVYTFITLGNASVAYWKDVDMADYEGELYIDGESVADDAYYGYYNYNKDSGKFYYMVDYNYDKGEGTLYCWNGKKSVEIKDDVHSFVQTPDGELLFLYDYSTSRYKGELWKWNGKKAVKLDDDVTRVFVVS